VAKSFIRERKQQSRKGRIKNIRGKMDIKD
jgi:hypothetical protein